MAWSLNSFMQIVHEPGNKIRYVPTCPGIVAGARRSAKRTTAKRVIALGCAETTSWGGGRIRMNMSSCVRVLYDVFNYELTNLVIEW